MKKFLAIILMITMAMTIVACDSAEPSDNKMTSSTSSTTSTIVATTTIEESTNSIASTATTTTAKTPKSSTTATSTTTEKATTTTTTTASVATTTTTVKEPVSNSTTTITTTTKATTTTTTTTTTSKATTTTTTTPVPADVLIISNECTISNQTIDTDVYITSTGVATFENVTVNGNIYCYGQLQCSSCTANDVYAYAYGSMMSCGAFDGTHGKVSGGLRCNRLTILDDALDYAFNKWGKR